VGEAVKPKKRCCKDKPRCKRCPVVLERLHRAGLAERDAKGRYVVSADKRQIKAARARKLG
jgi:hypothetical protein